MVSTRQSRCLPRHGHRRPDHPSFRTENLREGSAETPRGPKTVPDFYELVALQHGRLARDGDRNPSAACSSSWRPQIKSRSSTRCRIAITPGEVLSDLYSLSQDTDARRLRYLFVGADGNIARA